MSVLDEVQLVIFRVGGQAMAFNVFEVERILNYEKPVPLPKAPAFLEGVVRYAGQACPVIDLRKRLGAAAAVNDDTRIVMLEWDQGKIGVVVDAVHEIKKVAAAEITPPAPVVRGLAAEYISGILSLEARMVIILAAARLLNSTERITLESMLAEATTP